MERDGVRHSGHSTCALPPALAMRSSAHRAQTHLCMHAGKAWLLVSSRHTTHSRSSSTSASASDVGN
eukprot:2815750-Prymnesium_polylepis.1